MDTRRFGTSDTRKHTQRAVVDWLQGHHHFDWPALWGTIVAHRGACLLAALRALDEALEEPELTRGSLRKKMLAALQTIAERGPEALKLDRPE